MNYGLSASLKDRTKNPGNRTRTRQKNNAFFTGRTAFVFTGPDTGGGVIPWGSVEPAQLEQGRRWNAEQRLMWAVLQEARDNLKLASSTSRYRSALARDAEQWFHCEDETWLFSFRNICMALGLDPEWVRAGVLGARRRAA